MDNMDNMDFIIYIYIYIYIIVFIIHIIAPLFYSPVPKAFQSAATTPALENLEKAMRNFASEST